MATNTIADRLRDLRAQKGVNQDIAAEACDMSRVALARYETGQRVPRAEYVSRLADYYGVTVDFLIGRDEPAPIEKTPPPSTIDTQIMQELEGVDADMAREVLNYIKFIKQSRKG